uniref:Uncharacterized protein n=1 Tax=viral metagenome TaxID=1070528 RepID=A0A6C0BF44_9ZZZZ
MSTINYNDPEIKKKINKEYNELYIKVVNNLAKYIQDIDNDKSGNIPNINIYTDNLIMLDKMKQTIEKFNNPNP